MGHKTKPKVISLGKGLVGWWVGWWGWEERKGWRVIRTHSRHVWNCQITKLINREEQIFRGLNSGCQASRQVPLPAEPSSHHPLPFALVTLSTAFFSHFLVFQLMTPMALDARAQDSSKEMVPLSWFLHCYVRCTFANSNSTWRTQHILNLGRKVSGLKRKQKTQSTRGCRFRSADRVPPARHAAALGSSSSTKKDWARLWTLLNPICGKQRQKDRML